MKNLGTITTAKNNTGVHNTPDIVPTPLSLLRREDDDPNIPFDVRPCAKLLTFLKHKV